MKIAGSWASVLRGVSRQPAEVRQPGQHAEQINMLSDPVGGLTRRQGSIWKGLREITTTPSDDTLRRLTHAGYRPIEHTQAGITYITLWRESGLSTATGELRLPPVICYNKTFNNFLAVAYNAGVEAAINDKWVSAVVPLGQYVLFTLNSNLLATQGSIPYGATSNTAVIAWVRGGAYDRTYTVTFPTGSASYTTPAATGTNASAISPQAIATALGAAASAAGHPNAVTGSHIWFFSEFGDISTSDGGDGTLLRGLGKTIDDVNKLTILGRAGQIVYVQTGADEGYYLQAVSKTTGSISDNSFGEVIWRETAGTISASGVVGMGQAKVFGDTLYVGISEGQGANPSGMSHVPAGFGTAGVTFVPSISGDTKSNPLPRFLNGGQVSYMGLFQDRLLIAAGAAVAVSAAGDYLNFFRSSVVTVPLKDPFEMVAQGSEDDTLRTSVVYNRNLVIFGDKRQYLISGTSALTPTSANMSAMTVYENAEKPVAAGGQIYYARNTESGIAIHQIQPGAYVDSAESFPASGAVTGYIPSRPNDDYRQRFPVGELTAVPGSPAMLIVRSNADTAQGAPNRTLYVFSYIDAPDGRKQDAWHKWVFNEDSGSLLSVVYTQQGLLLFWVRRAKDFKLCLVADLLPLSAGLSTRPYLDSQRLFEETGHVDFVVPAINEGTANWSFAADATSPAGRFLIGDSFVADKWFSTYSTILASSQNSAIKIGLDFDSSVMLTNPIARDQAGTAITSGRTVISRLLVNFKQTAGFVTYRDTRGFREVVDHSAYTSNGASSQIGVIPVTTGVSTVPIGRECREYDLTISSKKWMPFTITGIEWIGQTFNRTPRA